MSKNTQFLIFIKKLGIKTETIIFAIRMLLIKIVHLFLNISKKNSKENIS